MSAVTVAVIVGFVCCALVIRALESLGRGYERRRWDPGFGGQWVRIDQGTPRRAMMKE
ncbi:hypothetical protein [Nocardia australiensis]|uniref:hypothetical protein n=1 Tax=Nocardia australiensis TaxID=2887191 RepID=UPI001D13BA01|nr:hypothetical protein [Nocardia australiensis]